MNYEIGIVFPLKDDAQTDRVACFERPPRKYAAGTDEPWVRNPFLLLLLQTSNMTDFFGLCYAFPISCFNTRAVALFTDPRGVNISPNVRQRKGGMMGVKKAPYKRQLDAPL